MKEIFNEFRESVEPLKHELGSILRSCLLPCLAGCVLTSWSLAKEATSLNNLYYKNFVIGFSEFKETILGTLNCHYHVYALRDRDLKFCG